VEDGSENVMEMRGGGFVVSKVGHVGGFEVCEEKIISEVGGGSREWVILLWIRNEGNGKIKLWGGFGMQSKFLNM
jgi:hypothetical protein